MPPAAVVFTAAATSTCALSASMDWMPASEMVPVLVVWLCARPRRNPWRRTGIGRETTRGVIQYALDVGIDIRVSNRRQYLGAVASSLQEQAALSGGRARHARR